MQDARRDMSRDDADDVSDGRWLTYAELAKLRSIDRASAFKLALRHKWRRQKNNQGQVTVFVPSDFTDQEDASPDNGYDTSRHIAAFETALAVIREAHAGEVTALRTQLQSTIAERDMSRDASYRAEARADELKGRLDQATAEANEQRIAAEAARAALEQARSEAQQAREQVEALRQAQDMSRDKVNAEVLGQAERINALLASLEAEAATKVAQAEAAADRARADARRVEERAETLRTAVDELKAGQGMMQDLHAQELAAAQREAQEAVEALQRAEAGRKARGRLRRAWDGWRGR
jgi:hypothetical protein